MFPPQSGRQSLDACTTVQSRAPPLMVRKAQDAWGWVGMTIQRTTLAIAVMLAILFVSMVGWNLFRVIEQRSNTAEMSEASATSSVLSKATIELSLERSVMQVTLNLPDPIASQFRALIDQQRALSDSGFDAVQAAVIAATDLRRAEEFATRFSQLRREVSTIREQADHWLALPRDQRPDGQVEDLPGRMKAAIGSLAQLPLTMRGEGVETPSLVRTLEDIQRRAWEIREYGGQERTLLAIAAATGEPFSRLAQREMASLHARAEAAMMALQLLADYEGLAEPVREQIQVVDAAYFRTYRDIRIGMVNAAANGRPYPIDFETFFAQSSTALATAVDLSYLAGDTNLAVLNAHQQRHLIGTVIYSAVLLVAIGICAFQMWFGHTRVSARLGRLAGLMQRVSDGDTSADTRQLSGTDEIAHMAATLESFRQAVIDKAVLESQQKAEAEKAMVEREKVVVSLAERIETETRIAIDAVAERSRTLTQAVRDILDRLEMVESNSSAVAEVADRTRRSTDQAVGASQALSAAFGEIDRRLVDSTALVGDASRTVADAGAAVEELTEAARTVGEVVQLIATIAEQTNLLALNATIEAARAGEAGRGFAVVAGEVKNLANQTRRSTEEIGCQIDAMRAVTGRTVELVAQVSAKMDEVRKQSVEITTTVSAQTSGTQAIAATLGDNQSQAIDSAERIDEVAHATREVRALAEGLQSISIDLDTQVTSIRATISSLTRDRAA